MNDYKIKRGYAERLEPSYCVDRPDGHCWQWQTYRTALDIGLAGYGRYIVDFGCGSGEKLQAFDEHDGFITIGIDTGSNIEYCKRTYPDRTWINGNLETMEFDFPATDAIYICADVVEHLKNPDPLLRKLASLQCDRSTIVISTPDRDLTHGVAHMGPPPNVGHVREWNLAEFQDYLLSMGFDVKQIGHIPCKRDDDRKITTMVVA